MNAKMICPLLCVAFIGALISLPPQNVTAQGVGLGGLGAAKKSLVRQLVEDYSDGDELFEVDFPGGTLGEFVELLRQQPYYSKEYLEQPEGGRKQIVYRQRLSVVITDEAKEFQLPAIKIVTDVQKAFDLINGETFGHSSASIAVNDVDDNPITFLVDVDRVENVSVSVINAKQLLESIPEANVLSAIEIGFGMQGGSSQVQLKLHQETGLLFVRGTGSEILLVQDIIDELYASQRSATAGMSIGGYPGGAGGMGSGKFSGGAGMGMGARAGDYGGGAGAGAGTGGLGGGSGGSNKPPVRKGGGKFGGGAGAGLGGPGGGSGGNLD